MLKLYTDGRSPNPRAAENIIAVKGIEVEKIIVDMGAGENRDAAFLKRNQAGQLPALETEDGQVIAEVAAIAEYLEEIKPDPVLVGITAGERAHTRMRMRQVDYLVLAPMMYGFRNSEGAAFFKDRVRIDPTVGAPMKLMAGDGLAWLDGQMQGQDFICGDRLSYVDCAFYPLVGFIAKVSQPIDPDLKNLTSYMQRLSEHEIIGAKSL
jgi:glutathione S-transferase